MHTPTVNTCHLESSLQGCVCDQPPFILRGGIMVDFHFLLVHLLFLLQALMTFINREKIQVLFFAHLTDNAVLLELSLLPCPPTPNPSSLLLKNAPNWGILFPLFSASQLWARWAKSHLWLLLVTGLKCKGGLGREKWLVWGGNLGILLSSASQRLTGSWGVEMTGN